MRLRFLGTGGGRVVTALQLRRTAGFRVELGKEVIHVDPGPGAALAYRQLRIPRDFSYLFVSHAHIDHYTDLAVLGEYLSRFGSRDTHGKILITEEVNSLLSDYHKEMFKPVVLQSNFKVKIGDFELSLTPIQHNIPGYGFLLKSKKFSLWYAADGRITENNAVYADVAIVNTISPLKRPHEYHATLYDAIWYAKEFSPKILIINHFGMHMLKYPPKRAAAEIERETGIRTIAAEDGMLLNIDSLLLGEADSYGLERFIG